MCSKSEVNVIPTLHDLHERRVFKFCNSLIPGQLAHMPGDSRSCAHIYVAIVTAASLGLTEHGSYQKACVHRNSMVRLTHENMID